MPGLPVGTHHILYPELVNKIERVEHRDGVHLGNQALLGLLLQLFYLLLILAGSVISLVLGLCFSLL